MNIKIKNFISTRYGIISILVFTLWVKTIIAYFTEFSLGVSGSLQYFILLINPIASAIILLSILFIFALSSFSPTFSFSAIFVAIV